MPDVSPHATFEGIVQVLILGTAGIAVVTDLRRRRVYNALTLPVMAIGLIANTVQDGASGFLRSATGLLLAGALFVVPVALGGTGAGDLKLLAALGALGGPGYAVWCALYTGIFGGVFAVAVLLARRRFVSVVGGMAFDLSTGQMPSMSASGIRLPYAVPIALGALVALVLRR